MSYKTYAEAKIANPDCEIVTTGNNWQFDKSLKGVFEALDKSEDSGHEFGYDAWVICNPADYCSTLKDFFDAGLNLACGDKYISTSGNVAVISNIAGKNKYYDRDENRYILSAAALNGGCKIPDTEQWTIYNNTLTLDELSDEQAAQLFNAWRAGGVIECAKSITSNFKTGIKAFEWATADVVNWPSYQTYRIKQKSERDLFIEASMQLMTSETERAMEQMFGAQFDSGKFTLVSDGK